MSRTEVTARFVFHFDDKIVFIILQLPFDAVMGRIVRFTPESKCLVKQLPPVQPDSAPNRRSLIGSPHFLIQKRVGSCTIKQTMIGPYLEMTTWQSCNLITHRLGPIRR